MALIENLNKLRKNSGAKSVGIYTFANFIGKGIAFLFLPYFTYALTKSDLGLVSLFSGSIIFLMPFVSLGILQSASADFFKLNKKTFRDFFTTTMIMPAIMCIVSIILLFLFRDDLYLKYKFPKSFVWIIPLVTFLVFINEHIINMIRNNNEPKKFLIVVIGRLSIEVLLAFFLISVIRWGWQGRITAILISYALLGLYAYYFFSKKGYLTGRIKKKIIKEELKYSIPVIVMQFSIFCLNSSDNFFLSRFTNDNNAQVGVYAISCIFASLILTLCSALLQFVIPKIYSLLSESEIKFSAIRKLFLFYVCCMFAGLILVLAFTPLVYKLFINKIYFPGLQYYYLICIGYFFWTITFFFYSFILYYKQKKKLLQLSLISILISLASNYFFIKNMGSIGAATSVCCCYFVVFIITVVFTRRQMGFVFTGNRILSSQFKSLNPIPSL